MCGISAIISMEGRLSNKNEINQLHSNIKHRGPDSCNFVFLDKVHLAHHRLAIIDVNFVKLGTIVNVEVSGSVLKAEVVKVPFYDPEKQIAKT